VEVSGTDITSLIITGNFGEGGTDKLSLGKAAAAITGATNSAVTIDIKGVTNVDSTEINFTNGAVDMSTKALTINGSNSNDQVTLKLLAATTKVKVDGDLGAGANSITITPDAAAGTLTSIDLGELKATGGTLEGTITIAAELTKVTTVKGSAGDDTVTFAQNTEDVTIDLGAGDDTFIGAKLAQDKSVTVTGGEGNDTFNLTASTVSAGTKADFTTITDFSTGDKITFAASDVAGYVNAGSLTSTGTLATDFATFASSHDIAKTVYGFTYNNESYLFYDVAGSTTGIDAADIIVKLAGTAGTVDLGSISLNSDTGVTIA
ncbi:hypothetical protein CFTCF782_08825, partial [Campylobacter fetus subsp. testudinum]